MNRGDVVLVHVPFVGPPGGKIRPALVVQNDVLNGILRETVIVEITSNLAHSARPHQVLIDLASPDVATSGLLANSAVRCERPHTIPQADVRRTIGTLSPSLMSRVDAALRSALAVP